CGFVTSNPKFSALMPSSRSFAAAASPFFASRDPRTTTTPCLPRSRAVSKPRPRLAPVMNATFPFGLVLFICSFHLLFHSIESEFKTLSRCNQVKEILHAGGRRSYCFGHASHCASCGVIASVRRRQSGVRSEKRERAVSRGAPRKSRT